VNLLDRLEGYAQEITEDEWDDKKEELKDIRELVSVKDKNEQHIKDLKDIVTNDEIIQDLIPKVQTFLDELNDAIDQKSKE